MKTEEKILETALHMFNRDGYVQVGVREIARELGISPGNLSYHFPKKEDILLRLLQDFSTANNQYYTDYYQQESTLSNFLHLMHAIFRSQFMYRGVYIGNQVIVQELQTEDRFNYQAIARKRLEAFSTIFSRLADAGQLQLRPDDTEFLVSFISIFGRFWISEALLFTREPDEHLTIRYYLGLLAKQLSLFATRKGMESLEEFRSEQLSEQNL